jgi:hypothetical protein
MTVVLLPDLGLQYGATLGEGSFAVYVGGTHIMVISPNVVSKQLRNKTLQALKFMR